MLATGGSRPTAPELRDGYFIEPTIFSGVDNGMRIAREEVFGPVLSAIRFGSEEELVRAANDSSYGLAAGDLDERPPARPPHGARHPRRHGVGQLLPQRVPDGAVRRLEDERDRARERAGEPARVHRAKTVWIELSGATRDPFSLG